MFSALIWIGLALAAPAQTLEERLQAMSGPFDRLSTRASEKLAAGDRAGGTAIFVDWAEEQGTVEAYLSVGNALWLSDPDASFRMHQRAVALAPGEPGVNAEWALELHRHERCADALPAYAIAAKGWDDGAPLWALYGHCLLIAGFVDEGLSAISRAGLRRSREQTESLFGEVYQLYNPWALRARLLAEARAGSADAWVEVVVRDLTFRHDLWNTILERKALDPDWREAQVALRDDPRLGVVRALVEQATGVPGADLRAELARSWPQELPGPYILTEQILVRVLQSDTPHDQTLATYGPFLRARTDAGSLRLFAALNPSGDGLEAIDVEGCDKFRLPLFCAGRHTLHLVAGEALDLSSDLKRSPNDPRFATLAVLNESQRGALPSQDALLRYLITEPRYMTHATGWAAAAMLLGAARHEQTPHPFVDVLVSVLEAELATPGPECGPWAPAEAQASAVCRLDAAP